MLERFDRWDARGGSYPWVWHFEEVKERRYGKEVKERRYGEIRSPKQFLRMFIACGKAFLEEHKKNPEFVPPEAFFKVMNILKPIVDEQMVLRGLKPKELV